MFDPWAGVPVLPIQLPLHDVVLVTRRVNAPVDHVARRLEALSSADAAQPIAVGDHGRLYLPNPPERADRGRIWRTRGRLYPVGMRLVPYVRVDIEVSAWSDSVSELFLRPTSRHPLHWGGRRLRRYVHLAPRTGEALVELLSAGDDRDEDHTSVMPARIAATTSSETSLIPCTSAA